MKVITAWWGISAVCAFCIWLVIFISPSFVTAQEQTALPFVEPVSSPKIENGVLSSELIRDQAESLAKTGNYEQINTNNFKVHTYETLCKGYIVENIHADKIEYIGYGDLADEYTYTIDTRVSPSSISSTSRNRI